MIVEYIRYSIAEDRREAFENAYAEAQTSLQASSHCLGWELTRCSEDLTQYILRIEWDSAAKNDRISGLRRNPVMLRGGSSFLR